MTAALADGRPCDDRDVEQLSDFNREFQLAVAALEDGASALSLKELRSLVAANVAVDLHGAIALLAEMDAASVPGGLLLPCKDAAASLLKRAADTQGPSSALAGGLALLVQIDAIAKAGQVVGDDLIETAQELLDPEHLPALGLATTGRLPLRVQTEKFAPTRDRPEPAPAVNGASGSSVERPTQPQEAAADGSAPDVEPEAAALDAAAPEEVSLAEPDATPPLAGVPKPAEAPRLKQAGTFISEGPDSDRPDATAVASAEPSDAEIAAGVSKLVAERRIGLAYWIVRSYYGDQGFAKALAALAYADAIRNPMGNAIVPLNETVQQIEDGDLRNERPAKLVALVAGLRATLHAPYSAGQALLATVAPSFSEPATLRDLIHETLEAGRLGLTLASGATLQVRDLATIEQRVKDIGQRAQDQLSLRTIKFQRASLVWQVWTSPKGFIHELLQPVVANRINELEAVEQTVIKWRDPKALESHIDDTDRANRSRVRQKVIEGDARRKLLQRVEGSLAIASEWIELSQTLDADRRRKEGDSWQQKYVANLRTAALAARQDVEGMWAMRSKGDSMAAGVARGTKPMIDEVFALLIDGARANRPEFETDEILGRDLLRVRDLPLDPQLRPTGEVPVAALLEQIEPTPWRTAFERRAAGADFVAADRIVEFVRRDDPDIAQELADEHQRLLESERARLQARHADAVRQLATIRTQGQIGDNDWTALNSQLDRLAVQPDQEDLAAVATGLRDFDAQLSKRKAAWLDRMRASLGERLASDSRFEPHRDRIEGLLGQGDISTLEEWITAISRNREPPHVEREQRPFFDEYFPTVVDAFVRDNVEVATVAHAVKGGSEIATLDFSELGSEAIESVLAALDSWQRLAAGELSHGQEDLSRVLRFIGLRLEEEAPLPPNQSERKRHYVIEVAAEPTDKALIPAFGSAACSRYRVAMLWDRVTAETIIDLLADQRGDAPLVVFSFRTLPSAVRREIAGYLRDSKDKSALAVVDRSAFCYLASKGGGRLATTMRITMPFTAINPYTRASFGTVPVEMFYGRQSELSEILEPEETSFIYGGRRLGKSALLRAAEREMRLAGRDDKKAIYVDLNAAGIGEWRDPGRIIEVLTRALSENDIMTSAAKSAPTFEQLREQVLDWLGRKEERRILLLLDECDLFLEADAKAEDQFSNVSTLKSLRDTTGGRFKPVFAGLHQVRRFERIPNQPLAHFGQPISIGPLEPRHAYDLVAKPLEALGYRFDPPELPQRILTATSYQPSLIQLLCHQLIAHMLAKEAASNAPPYVVRLDDLETVLQTPRVVDQMRERFTLTINLDPRYRVIAYTVAYEAIEGGIEAGLTSSMIREMCTDVWPAGFQDTTRDEFRALLIEMDSLGVLFEEKGRYFVRTPHVLRMLGTAEEIGEQLALSDQEPPPRFEATLFHGPFKAHPYERRPLTHQQSADLLERRGQVRVILGSTATGVDRVLPCIEEIVGESQHHQFCDDSQSRKNLLRHFRQQTRKKHRVAAYSAADKPPADVLQLVRQLGDKLPALDNGTTTAVIVASTDMLPIWGDLLAPTGYSAQPFETVELKRWSNAGLRAWAQAAQETDLPFTQPATVASLMEITGGWPMLVDRFVADYSKPDSPDLAAVLDALEARLASFAGARELWEAIGVMPNTTLGIVWDGIVTLAEPLMREEYEQVSDVGREEARRAYEVLDALQLVKPAKDGHFEAEPTAARTWHIFRDQLRSER